MEEVFFVSQRIVRKLLSCSKYLIVLFFRFISGKCDNILVSSFFHDFLILLCVFFLSIYFPPSFSLHERQSIDEEEKRWESAPPPLSLDGNSHQLFAHIAEISVDNISTSGSFSCSHNPLIQWAKMFFIVFPISVCFHSVSGKFPVHSTFLFVFMLRSRWRKSKTNKWNERKYIQ